MKAVKTRSTKKDIKILNRSQSLSFRMKDSYVRIKRHTQRIKQEGYEHSPSEYASSHLQSAAYSTANEASHLEIKRILPKKRSSMATDANKPVYRVKTDARWFQHIFGRKKELLLKAEEKTGRADKTANHAKQIWKEVQKSKRQTVQLIRQRAKHEQRSGRLDDKVQKNTGLLKYSDSGTRQNSAYTHKSQPVPSRFNKAKMNARKMNKLVNKRMQSPISGNTDESGLPPQRFPSYKNRVLAESGKTAKSPKISAKGIKPGAEGFKNALKPSVRAAGMKMKAARQPTKAARKNVRIALKTSDRNAKSAAKSLKAAMRIAAAALRGLTAVIAAGGWAAVMIILLICMIGFLSSSAFGVFFAGATDESGMTINSVLAEINSEYADKIDHIIASNVYDMADTSGVLTNWKEVTAVYAVKTAADQNAPLNVAAMDAKKAEILREIFWEMNDLSYETAVMNIEGDVLDAGGFPTGETFSETKTVLKITSARRTPDEMAVKYGFTDEQKELLAELLKPEYYGLWNSLFYGADFAGGGSILEVASAQIGNVGGELYWRWYGYNSRVAWCACFVSWCADQCGYIDTGSIPMFSNCNQGIRWFKDRDRWQSRSADPQPGSLIFFDWNGDGSSEHVGIVERIESGRVYTIEGNTSDSCTRRSYRTGSRKIMGYGVPAY